jgi:hypothetical protein
VALSNSATFENQKIWFALIPAIGTAASTIIIQARISERFKLREEGRIEIDNLCLEVKNKFANADSEAEYSKIYEEFRKRFIDLEKQQALTFFSFDKKSP